MGLRICPWCKKKYNENETCTCRLEKENQNEYRKEYYEKNKEQLKILTSARWRKLRLRIIQRDGAICQRCFYKYNFINGEELQVHHIKSRKDFPELTYEPNNLLTICKKCNAELGTTNKLDFMIEKKELEFNL